MDWKTSARMLFALTLIAIGVIGAVSGTFAPIWQPVPKTVPARELLAYACDLIAVGCGVGLLLRRSSAPAALVLLVWLILWAAVFKGPFVVHAPLVEGSYQSIGENAVPIAAAWVIYAELAGRRSFPAGDIGLRLAYLVYGLALIAFGLSHFVYLELTAPLVPTWLPGPVFWAYLSGAIYLVTGMAMALGFARRPAALVAAVLITLITILVWGPIVVAGSLSAMHWQETVVSWTLTAAAWVLASASPPATGWLRRPDRRDR
jgi:uncharacterized membrane protein